MYLRRIRKPGYPDDKCWFCDGGVKMTRSHVLLYCKNPKLMAARLEAWGGKNPGGVRVLLANPRCTYGRPDLEIMLSSESAVPKIGEFLHPPGIFPPTKNK